MMKGCVVCIFNDARKVGTLPEPEAYKKGNYIFCKEHKPEGATPLLE